MIIGVILVIGSTALKYTITPGEAYIADAKNLIEDGGFEEFNGTAGDCCKTDVNGSLVYASKCVESIEGSYSLNLTSENQCACINKQIEDFDNEEIYLMSFHYRGNNPRMCNWVTGDNRCLPEIKFAQTDYWTQYKTILTFTNNSERSLIHLYADSRDGKTYTNLYDDLQVRWLIPIDYPSDFEYFDEEEYIFKTKADNNINNAEIISDIDAKTGEAYFIVKGKPQVTIKFPWSEIVIIVIIMLVVVRLMFKENSGYL